MTRESKDFFVGDKPNFLSHQLTKLKGGDKVTVPYMSDQMIPGEHVTFEVSDPDGGTMTVEVVQVKDGPPVSGQAPTGRVIAYFVTFQKKS